MLLEVIVFITNHSFIEHVWSDIHSEHFFPYSFHLFLSLQIWLQPEKHQLHSAFSSLRALRLQGIFVEFGLLWTIALLEAPPYLETLHVQVLFCFSSYFICLTNIFRILKCPGVLYLYGSDSSVYWISLSDSCARKPHLAKLAGFTFRQSYPGLVENLSLFHPFFYLK